MLTFEGGPGAVAPELHDTVADAARQARAAFRPAVHGTATPSRSGGVVADGSVVRAAAATRTDARQRAAQRLELIDKGSCSTGHQTPLLFVHGAWHAAWCWDEGFLDFFAHKGYRALALSLRGHGGSLAPKPLRSISIADYVEDVVEVAQNLPTPPVVIGQFSADP
jgi:pimeloyl-ACP methyl ester carboxylesterase